MPVRGHLRSLVRASADEILAAAVQGGMKTLKQDGNRLVIEGITSLGEVRRITGDKLS